MKAILILSIALALSACQSDAGMKQSQIDETLRQWEQQAQQYQGNNQDLSVMSKRAIVLGRPELAENPYMKAYSSEYGRKQFGVESIYQIFLVYIDQSNPARNPQKAKYYLDKMLLEWPNSEQTKKSIEIYAKSGS